MMGLPPSLETNSFPPIPEKRYFTIGEMSLLCDVKPYVLRYWETEFGQIKPVKRRGNRRYYQHKDVLLIRKIRSLLYDQEYTISGARQQLVTEKVSSVSSEDMPHIISSVIADLERLLAKL